MARQLAGLVAYVALFAALIFGAAGTVHWPRAWLLLGVLLAVRTVTTVRLWRVQRSMLEERAKLPLHAEQPLSDRLLLIAFMASFAGLIAFAAWDGRRRHLLPEPPAWVEIGGILAFAVGWWVVYLALKVNAFAITVVRHQSERGHAIVEDGAYAVVRHPLYAGMLPVMTGLCAWLGSSAGLVATLVPVALLVARIGLEERLLRTRLPAYAAYAARVRWRLVPGLW